MKINISLVNEISKLNAVIMIEITIITIKVYSKIITTHRCMIEITAE